MRFLTDTSGAVTDTYAYDAFGALISRTGSTPNEYLYAGERLDANLGFYYLRARYMNPESGRFFSMDSYEGNKADPASLHKYLYANADPANRTDPTGRSSIVELVMVVAIVTIIAAISTSCTKPPMIEDGPTFQENMNSVQTEGGVFLKHFHLKIMGRNAQDRFLVVQWVRGYAKKNGKFLSHDPSMCKFGDADDPDWVIDNGCNGLARYPHVDPAGAHALLLVDKPGVNSVQSGATYEENMEFIVAVYDKKLWPDTTPASKFRTPTDPSPIKSYPWEFKETFRAP